MRGIVSAWACVVVAAVPLSASGAPAQARAAAAALFDEARHLMASGRAVEACPKFEESQRLRPGIGTLFNLASCYEKVGRTASAWTTYRDVLSQTVTAGQKERTEVVRERVRALEPTLAKLILEVPSPVPALRVTRDGVDAAAPLWGVAVPVDPGTHVLRATAPGYADWEEAVTVEGRGTVSTARVPALAPLEVRPVLPSPPRVNPVPTEPVALAVVEPHEHRPVRWQIPTGITGGALGVAGMGTGVALGLMAKSKADQAECDQADVCSAAGVKQRADAVGLGNAGTVVFIGSAVVGVAGAILLLAAPRADAAGAERVEWGIGPGSVFVAAKF